MRSSRGETRCQPNDLNSADFAKEKTVQKLIADYCGAIYGYAIGKIPPFASRYLQSTPLTHISEHGTVIYHDFTLNSVTGTLGPFCPLFLIAITDYSTS